MLPSAAKHARQFLSEGNILKMKLSLNWLLVFVPAALVFRFWPGLSNPTASAI
jgi:hypothetical protein